jgi:predicted esterase
MKGVELQQQKKTSTRETGGKAVTTFLLLHGTGGNERVLIQLACELDQRVGNRKSQRKSIRQRRCIPILCQTRRGGF